jgi:hypothetical protein
MRDGNSVPSTGKQFDAICSGVSVPECEGANVSCANPAHCMACNGYAIFKWPSADRIRTRPIVQSRHPWKASQ